MANMAEIWSFWAFLVTFGHIPLCWPGYKAITRRLDPPRSQYGQYGQNDPNMASQPGPFPTDVRYSQFIGQPPRTSAIPKGVILDHDQWLDTPGAILG
jgi:hypothetical protein